MYLGKIAEVDLEIRGPGEFLGTRQSGGLPFKIANIVKDKDILQQARYYAKKVLKEDSHLIKPKNINISNTFKALSKYKNIWNYIS